MRKYTGVVCLILLLFLISCAPVLKPEIMSSALRDISPAEIKHDPDSYRGKLFVFGGIIVSTKATAEGSLVEAIYVPVDSRGYLKDVKAADGRFLALFSKESGILDPLIFKRERQITLAGEFVSLREGKIDDMEYTYPFFKIVQIYLWPIRTEYYPIYYEPYPYWWDYPYWWHRPYYRPYWW
ncbi:MAG: Slp family lipoprotein [Nitrospirota bacterium]